MSLEEVFTKEFNKFLDAKIEKVVGEALDSLGSIADLIEDKVESTLRNTDLTDFLSVDEAVSDCLDNTDLTDHFDIDDYVSDSLSNMCLEDHMDMDSLAEGIIENIDVDSKVDERLKEQLRELADRL